ncbi:outer membrane protein [Yoonia sp.]|uniref:outer membrane protein n=1 Tax=Yoonia sp. TaxID=2212373 RepID=UPI002FDA12D2
MLKRLILATALTLTGHAASAQDVYVGGSVDYMLPHDGDTQVVISGIAGMGFDAGPVGVGAEAEYGLRAGGDADYDTARVRGWVSYDWGHYTLRAGGGITEYYFDDTNYGGYHALLGAERDLTDRLSLRGEFIRDFVDDAFAAGITTTRVGVVFNF